MDNVVEFANKKQIETEACQWVLKFDSKQAPTDADIEQLKQWAAQSAAHREALVRYSNLWQDMNVLSELLLPLQENHSNPMGFGRKFAAWLMMPWFMLINFVKLVFGASARVVLPVAGVGAAAILVQAVFIWGFPKEHYQASFISSIGQQRTLNLPDGSEVWLNTNSVVDVDFTRAVRHINLVRGEAYFKVAKDAQRPFEVYTGSNMVQAVGTAFLIRKKSDAIQVTVTEGKVNVAALQAETSKQADPSHAPKFAANNSVTSVETYTKTGSEHSSRNISTILGSLSAGQTVTVAQSASDLNNAAQYQQQEVERQLSWREGLLVFSGEPLSEVVNEVSRYTTIKITLADPELQSLRIGGQFHTGETEALFDILETGFGLKISRLSDSHVTIEKFSQD
ncbi:FecR family protein [Halioxenophilus sp. WMMB6]|uniref:FecR family protein n=1 Tax=Halioxenophilus sp. WMMB6 TaxID=3073815 RepID=UPI00295E8473|nr:FecR domain-containing protein [Halioxenophilus sp. WMMB6]